MPSDLINLTNTDLGGPNPPWIPTAFHVDCDTFGSFPNIASRYVEEKIRCASNCSYKFNVQIDQPLVDCLLQSLCIDRVKYRLFQLTNFPSWRGEGRVPGVCWLLACLLNVSGTDLHNVTCCHTEKKVADQTFYLTVY